MTASSTAPTATTAAAAAADRQVPSLVAAARHPAAAGGRPDGVVQDQRGVRNNRAVRPAGRLAQLRQLRDGVHRAAACCRGFVNTAFILVVSLVGTVLIGSMAAYAIDRFQFRLQEAGRRRCSCSRRSCPGVTTQVATFQIVNDLGLYNTRWSPIVLFMGTDIISIYIFLQFMRGIPRDARRGGDDRGRRARSTIYWRIILPLLKPAIATVVIIKGIAIYNEFYIPFLYMPSRTSASSPRRCSASRARTARSGRSSPPA